MSFLGKHRFFGVFYGALFFYFTWPLLLLKKTFILGDYATQFYPWSFWFARELKTGHLPYWISGVTCGFPLMAEGQVGGYYPIHLLSYLVLPFEAAYAWSIPAHLLAGALGMYFYCRRSGLSSEGSALAAVVFSFSSAYGGCFYTTGTLRVLTWLPWSLFLLETLSAHASASRRVFQLSMLSICFWLMWTAGFPQAALYSFLYLALFIGFRASNRRQLFLFFALAALIGALLAMPQLTATAELAKESVREGRDAAFALWGSVLPPAPLTLIYPHLGKLLRVSFYLGIFPLCLVLLTLFLKKTRLEKAHGWLAAIFFLLALGRYNPAYAWLVKALGLTFVRNPSKFLFFTIFSLAVVAGCGFDRCLRTASEEKIGRFPRRPFLVFLWAVILLPLGLTALLSLDPERWQALGHRFAEFVFSQKSDSLRSLSDYYAKTDAFWIRLRQSVSYGNFWTLNAVGLSVLSVFLLVKRASGRIGPGVFKWMVMALILWDLGAFGSRMGVGFMGNAARVLFPAERAAVVEALKETEGPLLMVEWNGRAEKAELLEPSSNLLDGVPHAGGYSPLLLKRYYELTRELGFVDSSEGRRPFSMERWTREKKLLDALGVNQIVSDQPLDLPGVTLMQKIGEKFIYRNADALPPVYAVSRWKVIESKKERLEYLKSGDFDPKHEAVLERTFPFQDQVSPGVLRPEIVTVQKSEDRQVLAQVEFLSAGVLVFRNAYYPRWKAEVGGRAVELIPVNHALCGVILPPGVHDVRFYYDGSAHHVAELVSFAALFFLVSANGFLFLRSRRKGASLDVKRTG